MGYPKMYSNFRFSKQPSISLIWLLAFVNCQDDGEVDQLIRLTAIHIRPDNFETVLYSKSPFLIAGDGNENKRHHMLHIFTKFLMIFDFREESDVSFQQLKRICRATAKYNLKLLTTAPTNNSKLELLISVVPHDGFTKQVELVTSTIREMCDGTVTTFIINYRFQRFGEETLPLVNNDISISHQIINNHSIDLTLGTVMDVRNCYGSDRHLRKLPWNSIDLVIVRAMDMDEQNMETFTSTKISCGFKIKNVKMEFHRRHLIFGFVLPVFAELSANLTTYSFNRTRMSELIRNNYIKFDERNTIPLLDAEAEEFKINQTSDPVTRTMEAQEHWLNVDENFSLEFTGTSIYAQNQSILSGIVPLIWGSFCKILLHATPIGTNVTESLEYVRRKIPKYYDLLLQTEPLNSQCGRSSNEIFVAVNAFASTHSLNHMTEINRALLIKLATSARRAEKSRPGTPAFTFLLNFEGCFGRKWCEGLTEERTFMTKEYLVDLIFLPKAGFGARTFIANLKFNRPPKIGIMLHWSFCHQLRSFVVTSLVRRWIIDTVVFTLYLHPQDILEQGALKVSMVSIARLQHCNSFFQKHTHTVNVTTLFHIEIVGCVGLSSNIIELIELTRFSELISQWGDSIEKTIIIGPAFEDSTTTKCLAKNLSNKSMSDLTRTCGCGWWRAAFKPGNIQNAQNWTFETKKSIARKLFHNIHSPILRKAAVDQTASSDVWFQVLVPTFIFSVLIICITIMMMLRFRNKRRLVNRDIEEFFRGRHTQQYIPNGDNGEAFYLNTTHTLPYNRELYEIPQSKFEIDFTRSLGSGEYGVVYRGKVNSNEAQLHVAAKMAKTFDSRQNHSKVLAVTALISEIKVLSYVGSHPHVIQLVGAYTAKLITGKLCVFLELCELGSLKNFLRSYVSTNEEHPQKSIESSHACKVVDPISSRNCGGPSHGLSKDLHRWSREIAAGMEFIASKNIVHADLATRNVLLNSERCAKISDFGLSRRLYDYSDYVKQQEAPLPWRWMAPESLRRLLFNEKTDVWAYGVTLWEIFTLGDEPYPGLTWVVNFPQMLECGIRLEEPRCNEKRMYDIMKRCWSFDPDNRPCFSELVSTLGD